MNFFKHKPRSPVELVRVVADDFGELGVPKDGKQTVAQKANGSRERDVHLAKATKHAGQLRVMLTGQASDGRAGSGEPGQASTSQQMADEAAVACCKQGLLRQLCLALQVADLEMCKDIAAIFNAVVQRQIDSCHVGVQYVAKNRDILSMLCDGYKSDSTALHCGSMLRQCLRDHGLARIMLVEPGQVLLDLFAHVDCPMFEVASDAFETFRDLLAVHKSLTAELLRDKYDVVTDRYRGLLTSENFVTRRQALKLLGELLLDHLKDGMLRFIGDPQNLMLMMNLLKDASRTIQYEAFHVFKVFVANPSKPQSIVDILCRNREKLVTYLESFQNDRENDQFKNEKAIVLQQINILPAN